MKPIIRIVIIIAVIVGVILSVYFVVQPVRRNMLGMTKHIPLPTIESKQQYPLTISAMRDRSYPGSSIAIEQTLPDEDGYHQYITSYQSDGLKIYALLTVPMGNKPKNGWPVIVFNHGYIQPDTYQTFPSVGQYATYLPVFARNGYIVFKPDYRGNGNSDGKPEGAYYSPAYTVDDLNAIASIKKYKDANPSLIGMWGHSMGGNITLRDLVVKPNDIKAAVIWGGVVGSYTDLSHWHDPFYHPPPQQLALRNKHRADLIKQFGTPEQNPTFWHSIDPTYFVSDIIEPVQLDVGGSDEEVPPQFSKSLQNKLQAAGKTVEYYEYPGGSHNISQSFNEAMQHSLDFFNKYLKN